MQFAHGQPTEEKGQRKSYEKEVHIDGAHVRVVKWCDNRVVTVASTFGSAEPIGKAKRYDQKLKAKIDVPQPKRTTLSWVRST
ncbi:hypothetical protein HPB47_013417, partial [Ixodes persulcatus]